MNTKISLTGGCGLTLLKAPPRVMKEPGSVPHSVSSCVFRNTELSAALGLSLFNLTDFSISRKMRFNLRLERSKKLVQIWLTMMVNERTG
jgi:hypothetical protein